MNEGFFKGENARRYFETRLPKEKWAARPEVQVHCPFHEDGNPSLSVKPDEGVWCCHAGCGSGGMLAFEMKLSNCDRETALANIARTLGKPVPHGPARKPDAVYPYPDAMAHDIVEKLRFHRADGSKYFEWRRPNGKGGYVPGLPEGFRKRLYRLPEVVRANAVVVVEGEKDADRLAAALAHVPHLAVTTSPDGASQPGKLPKWLSEFGPYFAGKETVIIADNDAAGLAHAEAAVANIFPFAARVKVVTLPGLPEHGDVSDFLDAGHTAEDLLKHVKTTPWWKPPAAGARGLSLPAPRFWQAAQQGDIDWLLEGVIQRGANGFFCAAPKGGKSWASLDLAISLALGCDWLGFRVLRPLKVLLVSREDNPALTAWRLRHLFAGKGAVAPNLLETNLHINSRQQTPELMIDNPEQVEELRAELKRLQCEFLILDVFNVMHGADENDNQEMRRVLRVLSRLQTDFGCSIGVVHHYNKLEGNGPMTQRLRGSSAIAGWAEWLIGIRMVDEEEKIRCLDVESKAAPPPDPVNFRIVSGNGTAALKRVAPATPFKRKEPLPRESVQDRKQLAFVD